MKISTKDVTMYVTSFDRNKVCCPPPKKKKQKNKTKQKENTEVRIGRNQEDYLFCGEPLLLKNFRDSFLDHCHVTGKYQSAAHNACNLKLRLSPKTTTIPVVFHNLRGYDSHLIMQAISRVQGKISCIPNNTEKYTSFSMGQLRFIDSVQFLLTFLDRLVATSQPEAFQITARYKPNREKRDLLLHKGVYPYECMDAWERFAEPRLPPKEAFYSKLTDEGISEKDYTHAQNV